MFGLGIWEVVVILAVALIAIGPRRLPAVAKQLGRALREFRRATNELKYNLEEAAAEPRRRPVVDDPYAQPTEVTGTPRGEMGPPPPSGPVPQDATPQDSTPQDPIPEDPIPEDLGNPTPSAASESVKVSEEDSTKS